MEFVPHTAALLAGGKSTRMGRDKAALLVDGVPLWQRQLAILQATAPAELLVSGPLDGVFACGAGKVIPDIERGLGPLGGLASIFGAATQPWLLVLAIDLPFMPAEFLCELVAQAERTGRGVVPVTAAGQFEPLAAVYPQNAGVLAKVLLASGERRLATWVARLEAQGLIERRKIEASEEVWFTNWNHPEDIVL